jgi:serine/threonine-protein kinase
MSPEQIRAEQVDARSDIYSLGIALYELVTGRRPIGGASNYEMMNAHFHQIPQAPAEVLPTVPRGLSDAILKALAKDPGERFQTAAEFRSALREVLTADADVHATKTLKVAASVPSIAPADLARIEERLSRVLGPIARRLVADGARSSQTSDELCARLAEQIPDPREREAFVKSCGAPTTSSRPSATVAPESSTRTWDPALLARLAQALTAYLGPIATVVVNRAAKKARSETDLLGVLAAEIPDDAERKRFLATRGG